MQPIGSNDAVVLGVIQAHLNLLSDSAYAALSTSLRSSQDDLETIVKRLKSEIPISHLSSDLFSERRGDAK